MILSVLELLNYDPHGFKVFPRCTLPGSSYLRSALVLELFVSVICHRSDAVAVLSCTLTPGSRAVLSCDPPGSGVVPRCALPGSGAVLL